MNLSNIFRKKKDPRDAEPKKNQEEADSLREELDDYLDAINRNSNEIQNNYELICDLDSKIEKLNEKIDRIQMLLEGKEVEEETRSVTTLTFREQEIFLVLYTCDNQSLTYKDIARKTGLTELLVQGYILNLIKKGIPIIKKYVNNKIYLALEKEFRDLHTKNNIVKIDSSISRNISL